MAVFPSHRQFSSSGTIICQSAHFQKYMQYFANVKEFMNQTIPKTLDYCKKIIFNLLWKNFTK